MSKMQCVKLMVQHGCKIFPIERGKEKSNAKPYLGQATADFDKLRRYSLAHPKSHFAVACGGRIAVLHVQGREALSRLLERNRELTEVRTIIARFGADLYFYFRAANDSVPPGKTQVIEGVTLLGAGQFVLCPGSVTCVGTVGFIRGRQPDQVGLADLPKCVFQIFSSQDAIDEEIKCLAKLSRVDYEHQRNEAAKRLKLRKPALDDLVEQTRTKPKTATSQELVPWTKSVDGGNLLNAIFSVIDRHVVLKKNEATAIALWIVHTHALEAFDVTPRLAIKSPMKQCGKSLLLDVLSELVKNPIAASNITAPSLFRLIDQDTPTVLIDEADTFLIKDDALRGILNSGHRRNTAFVVRAVGENLQPRRFSTWAPVVIACIGGLPETIEDRSIQVTLRRRLPDEHVEPFRYDRAHRYVNLVRASARWSADHLQLLKAADPKVPDGLANREADNWRPLLAIADAAGGAWPEQARRAAEMMVASARKSDTSVQINLLNDIRSILAAHSATKISSADLVVKLVKLEGRPWSELRGNHPITQNTLAVLLRAFNITPGELRIGAKVLRGYRLEQFTDTFARYL